MYSEGFLQQLIDTALSNGGVYADVFIEDTADTIITMDSSKIKTVQTGLISGGGIRVIYGRSYVYVYASNLNEQKLIELAEAAKAAVKADFKGSTPLKRQDIKPLYTIEQYPSTVSMAKKAAMLKRADDAARGISPKIQDVVGRYWDNDQNVLIATSEGRFVEDRRTRTRFAISAIAGEGDKKETGFFGPGKSLGFEFFNKITPESVAERAAKQALILLDADYAPQGKLPVVIDNGFGGVIFHEACGHALEATSVADDASVFSGKLGEKIASDVVSAVDNGAIPNEWGSLTVDDEGHPTTKNQLIENGILKSFMVDKLGSIKMDHPTTGAGRKQSYEFAPTSRMTNTFITPGNSTLEEMISTIDYGLYCKDMGGGSVNPPTTDFNFAVREAYLIKNGKIDKAVKGASLIGKGSEILKNIEMVGQELDYGTGMCGSQSGSIPANVGQAPVKVTGLVVGGRE